MTLGKRLYELRKKAGLSQEELADKVHSSRQAVSKWENDQAYPETERLMELSDIFNVSIDYLLRGTKTETTTALLPTISSDEVDTIVLTNKKTIRSAMSTLIVFVFTVISFNFFRYINVEYIRNQERIGYMRMNRKVGEMTYFIPESEISYFDKLIAVRIFFICLTILLAALLVYFAVSTQRINTRRDKRKKGIDYIVDKESEQSLVTKYTAINLKVYRNQIIGLVIFITCLLVPYLFLWSQGYSGFSIRMYFYVFQSLEFVISSNTEQLFLMESLVLNIYILVFGLSFTLVIYTLLQKSIYKSLIQ